MAFYEKDHGIALVYAFNNEVWIWCKNKSLDPDGIHRFINEFSSHEEAISFVNNTTKENVLDLWKLPKNRELKKNLEPCLLCRK